MNEGSKYSVGVDIGGTNTRACVCTRAGEILAKDVRKTGHPSEIVSQIKTVLKDRQIGIEKAVGIGIGSVGPLDRKQGLVLDPVNIPSWKKVPLVEIIGRHFSCPIYLDNDANAAALAEKLHGVQLDNLIYITVSTGIGGGIITDGLLVHGQGNASEVGHMIILPSGPVCNCGKRGCLEALSSGTAIARRGKELLDVEDTREVFRLARQGDLLAQQIINDAAYYLGIGIANLSQILDPQCFVVGGGVTNSWDQMGPRVQAIASSHSLTDVRIEKSTLGEDIGLIGAAMLPFHHNKRQNVTYSK